jgi:hypothetical protein
MHRCLPYSGKELVSSRLDGGCLPEAPRSNSVLGPIRHDMQEYYDQWPTRHGHAITNYMLS